MNRSESGKVDRSASARCGRIPILLYHSVHDQPPAGFRTFTVGEQQFHEHLSALEDSPHTVVDLDDVVSHIRTGSPLPPRPVVITFDDGYADTGENAFPALQEFGYPSTLYTVTAYMGLRSTWLASDGAGRMPMLDAADLRHLDANGMTIGSHTVTHPWLDSLPHEAVRRELTHSMLTLSETLGRQVTTLAYPHGFHSPRTTRIAQQIGYSSAAAVRERCSHGTDNVFALARLTITNDMGPESLLRAIETAPTAPPRTSPRTFAGRQLRRIRYRIPLS